VSKWETGRDNSKYACSSADIDPSCRLGRVAGGWLRDARRIQASLRRIQGAAQNTRSVTLPLAEARQAVVSTFIKDGFNITQAHSDLVTATRTIKESKDEELSYVVSATAAIAASGDGHTLVALSADQQTVLHRATHDWFHLLWVVPLFPYATEYQTVVRSESTVDDPKFYGSFFSELDRVAASVKAESGAEFPDALQPQSALTRAVPDHTDLERR
jgi:hypothetical protein